MIRPIGILSGINGLFLKEDLRMIDLKNIDVTFNVNDEEINAVKNVDLNVEKGDIYGIVGYSGAGKSTLVRVINLLQRPTKGEVRVEGKDFLSLSEKELREERKNIGMIFQHFNLMNQRTVYENVAYPLRGSDLSDEEKDAKILELLSLVKLDDRADHYPSELSGGQKQRVGIARSLANDPKILLCDEATSSLDPKTTEQILDLLKELNEELGITIVLITHEMEAVRAICNKVAVMEDGEIVEQNDIVSIFTSPSNPLTQEFIRTATGIDQSLNSLIDSHQLDVLKADDEFVLLNFVGASTGTPLISSLYEKFKVSGNILYANVDNLNNTPVGTIALILSGEPQNLQDAITYIEQKDVAISKLQIVNENGNERVTVA